MFLGGLGCGFCFGFGFGFGFGSVSVLFRFSTSALFWLSVSNSVSVSLSVPVSTSFLSSVSVSASISVSGFSFGFRFYFRFRFRLRSSRVCSRSCKCHEYNTKPATRYEATVRRRLSSKFEQTHSLQRKMTRLSRTHIFGTKRLNPHAFFSTRLTATTCDRYTWYCLHTTTTYI